MTQNSVLQKEGSGLSQCISDRLKFIYFTEVHPEEVVRHDSEVSAKRGS